METAWLRLYFWLQGWRPVYGPCESEADRSADKRAWRQYLAHRQREQR